MEEDDEWAALAAEIESEQQLKQQQKPQGESQNQDKTQDATQQLPQIESSPPEQQHNLQPPIQSIQQDSAQEDERPSTIEANGTPCGEAQKEQPLAQSQDLLIPTIQPTQQDTSQLQPTVEAHTTPQTNTSPTSSDMSSGSLRRSKRKRRSTVALDFVSIDDVGRETFSKEKKAHRAKTKESEDREQKSEHPNKKEKKEKNEKKKIKKAPSLIDALVGKNKNLNKTKDQNNSNKQKKHTKEIGSKILSSINENRKKAPIFMTMAERKLERQKQRAIELVEKRKREVL